MSVSVEVRQIPLDLPPTEFKAAHVLARAAESGAPRLRTVEIAELVGITIRHAQRVLLALIKRGLAFCEARGLYRSSMSPEATSMSPDWYVYKPIASSPSSEGTSYPLLGAAPEMSESSGGAPMYDYEAEGDDLSGVGMVTPRKSLTERVKTSLKRKPRVPTAHREVDRSQWTMEFVAKEFRIRCKELDPLTVETWRTRVVISPTGGNEMTMALKAWQAQYGITPQEAATCLDQFFADTKNTDRIDSQTPAYKHYLHYLKTHVDRLRMNTVTDADMDRVTSQVFPWD